LETQSASPQEANETALSVARSAAHGDRKPAIVTIRRRGKRFGDVPDMTPEEHKRRGDVAVGRSLSVFQRLVPI
jgi:hypothetical protein